MKKLLRISLLLVVGIAVILAFAGWKARQYLTPEALAAALEENINSRVQIGGVEVSLFSVPARVVLEEVQLGMRDAEMSKPYAERAPMRGAPVSVGEVRLGVSLFPLLERRLAVKELLFREPRVTMMLFEKGGNSLDELFRAPETKKDSPKKAAPAQKKEESETLNISQLGILASLHGVGLENGEVNVVLEKTSLSLRVENLQIALRDLEIDPAALASIPAAELDLSGVLLMDSSRQQRDRYGRLGFSGTARAQFFDPASGDFAVAADTDLLLDEDSYLGTNIPVVAKAWDKLQKLDKVGIKIGPLPEKVTFGRSESMAVRYSGGLVTLSKPLSLLLDDWELALREGTWIQTEKDTHEVSGELVASGKLSDKFREQMAKGSSKVPKELRPELAAAVEEAWFREGRLHARITSSGELSKPSLDVPNKVPDLESVAKEAAKRYARERLDRLFGRDKE